MKTLVSKFEIVIENQADIKTDRDRKKERKSHSECAQDTKQAHKKSQREA